MFLKIFNKTLDKSIKKLIINTIDIFDRSDYEMP